jgi:hypothetical protein
LHHNTKLQSHSADCHNITAAIIITGIKLCLLLIRLSLVRGIFGA